jgi:uncharacterized oligopeptide transporter (OPT) family protein
MKLDMKTILVFVVLTIVMATNNIYTTLLTGWGDGGAIISVILAFMMLSRTQGNIVNLNLAQTMASGGGSVGFTTAILTSFYVLDPAWSPNIPRMIMLVMSVSVLGCIVSIPLRRIIREWYFPSGVACATVLQSVTGADANLRRRTKKIMYGAGGVAALLSLPNKVAFSPGGSALISKISLPAGLGISLDPLLYGIGMVVGARTGISMFVAGLIMQLWYGGFLAGRGYENIGDHIKWTAVGLMTIPAFISIGLSYLFRVKQTLPSSFTPRQDTEADRLNSTEQFWIGAIGAVALIVSCAIMKSEFNVGPGWVLLGVLLAFPMVMALAKVAADTDINPVRLIAIVLLGLFALMATMDAPQLLAVGIFCGAAMASIAIDLFYDLRTGYLIGANPKPQLAVQFAGIVIASLVSIPFLHFLATNFGFGEGHYFPAPGAHVWAAMAGGFAGGSGALTGDVLTTFFCASGLGTLLAIMAAYPKTRAWALSPTAMGIGLLLPVEMGPAIAIGGLLAWYLNFRASDHGTDIQERINNEVTQAGSAIFAASAVVGIIAVILITLGLVYVPA